MHVIKGVGRLVESFMMTYEKMQTMSEHLTSMGIENTLEPGCEGLWGGFKVENDKVWEDYKNGKYPEFSIGGSGRRVTEGEEGS
jgi:hypothetical protein